MKWYARMERIVVWLGLLSLSLNPFAVPSGVKRKNK